MREKSELLDTLAVNKKIIEFIRQHNLKWKENHYSALDFNKKQKNLSWLHKILHVPLGTFPNQFFSHKKIQIQMFQIQLFLLSMRI